MPATCPTCGAESPGEGKMRTPGTSTCPKCPKTARIGPSPARLRRGLLRRAPKLRVRERPGEIEISWPWFNPPIHLFMAVFSAVWDTFLIYWYWRVVPSNEVWILNVVFAVIPVVHGVVGAALTYATLAGFWNRTTLRATREGVSLRGGPLPAFRKVFHRREEIRQVYAWVVPGGTPAAPAGIQLLAADVAGGDFCLIQSLESEPEARGLARKITEILPGTL